MTTGTGGDPESLAVPANARVEPWWPQADVMPHAAAVVGHGGFGTTMFAVTAGVPQVVVPLFAFDQTVDAERIAASGAGIHLSGGTAAVAEIPPAITAVLTEHGYRDRAQSPPRSPGFPTSPSRCRSSSTSPAADHLVRWFGAPDRGKGSVHGFLRIERGRRRQRPPAHRRSAVRARQRLG
jgi:hypothetical protein